MWELFNSALFLLSKIMADSENCGFVTSLCPGFRLRPGYMIFIYAWDLRIGQLSYLRRNWNPFLLAYVLRGMYFLRDGYPNKVKLLIQMALHEWIGDLFMVPRSFSVEDLCYTSPHSEISCWHFSQRISFVSATLMKLW